MNGSAVPDVDSVPATDRDGARRRAVNRYASTVGQGTWRVTVVSSTFSPSVVKQIGKFGQVEIRAAGEVADIEGYPPLSDETRRAIRTDRWTFPADLPISELETRLEEKLRKDHDLSDAIVSIDTDGEATISAAPATGSLSRRVPDGKQVVTVDTILPSGIAAGDTVRMNLDGTTLSGQVISTRIDGDENDTATEPATAAPPEGDDEEPAASAVETDGTHLGGNGRVALAVDPDDVPTVVEADLDKFYVRSRGQNREYELVSLLRRNGNKFRRFTLRPESEYLDRTIGELDLRTTHGVVVLALRRADEWQFAPDYMTTLRPDDELFVTGPETGLDALQEGAT
jgi:hypothetical protein